MTGRTLGHYEILEKLGEGGMGVVYKARDARLARFAAVKVLPAARVGDGERRVRFMQEARAASALNHPNIITVYEVNVDRDDLYIAMELVEGKPLDQLIPAGGMRIKAALDAAIQVADVLAKAHTAGLVHRDLKPGNIMLTADGRVKLLDFGLAKFIEGVGPESATCTMATLTQEGSIVGTAAYMSPEQAEGKPVDARSDLFSFGAVLYEMLSGQRAFRGESIVSTLAAVLEKDPAPLSAAVPRDVERIVTHCLRKEPPRRFQHAGDIRLALEDALSGAETGGASATGAQAARRPRFRWSYLGIAAAVVLAWGAGWWFRTDPRPPTDLDLKRLTGDPGLIANTAISPDGQLIAYSSDRAGNGDLDIWVQHRRGGDPIRITNDTGDESDPSFSADGAQIIYRARDGIYLVPALGGDPRHLAKSGGRPRLSPDGKRVVYQNAGGVRFTSQVFLLDVASGQPRRVAEKLPGARYPVWSPDGRYLLIESFDRFQPVARQAIWWLVSADTLEPLPLGPSPGIPEQWLPGDRILFTTVGEDRARLDASDVTNLGVVAISPRRTRFTTTPRRLTNGTAILESGSVAADGTMVVRAGSYRSNLWILPLDANAGKVMGPAQPLTQDVAFTVEPSISSDGRRLAFTSDRDGDEKVWLMDLPTRSRRRLTPLSGREYRPVLSPDGMKLAYGVGVPIGNPTTMVADLTSLDQPAAPHMACRQECAILWGWWPDSRGFLVTLADIHSIGLVPPAGGAREFTRSTNQLFQPIPSPDGQWMFIVSNGTKIAHLQNGKMPDPSQWKPTGEHGDLYRWSPDGNTVYFVDDRDKFLCIWGRHLNPATKQPVGEAFSVYHSHGARLSMLGLSSSSAIGPAVARDKIVFAQAERTGNVWIGKLDLK
jgi:Tol biopolymer transport system component/predicted Ser/Thr protein kinase